MAGGGAAGFEVVKDQAGEPDRFGGPPLAPADGVTVRQMALVSQTGILRLLRRNLRSPLTCPVFRLLDTLSPRWDDSGQGGVADRVRAWSDGAGRRKDRTCGD